MNEHALLQSVEAALLDYDGSCRDINFSEWITTPSANAIVEFLASSWSLAQATTAIGKEVQLSDIAIELQHDSGSLATVWSGGSNPRQIQAYFYWDKADQVFCELTFFPDDLDRATFTLKAFLRMLSRFAAAASSTEYYLRFENAAWRHGEPMKYGDVILSHETLSLSALRSLSTP